MRWDVQTTKYDFDDVGADRVAIAYGGTLVFTDTDGNLLVAYASGQWRTVTPQEGED